jgi:hypothetical protein
LRRASTLGRFSPTVCSFASGTFVFRSHLWLAQEPLAVGDWSETHKVFDTPEVAQFAALSEDINPIHLDAGAALLMNFCSSHLALLVLPAK